MEHITINIGALTEKQRVDISSILDESCNDTNDEVNEEAIQDIEDYN
jgi:hypothetical protein